jgi:hypothetical protein
MITVSWVSCATAVETRPIALEKVISAIRTGGKKLKGQIEQIRNRFDSELALTGDYKAAKEVVAPLKKQLPGVLYSAKKIARRENEALEEHSGLFCADQDRLGDAFDEVRTQLTKSPHVMLAFRSPCGDGIKSVFKVVPNISRHRDSFRAIRAYVLQLTGKEIDDKCKDEARMNFLSFDPQIYVNLDAVVIEPLPPLPKREYSLKSAVTADLGLRQRCAVELLGAIDWDSISHGFLPCPGKHLHSTGEGERDCEIHLDGAPTLHCFHNHCSGILAGLNHELRSRIAKVERENAPKEKKTSNSHKEALPAEPEKERRESDATALVRIARAVEGFCLFHDPQDRPFVWLKNKGHTEVWPVESTRFRRLLGGVFFKEKRRSINRNALGDAITTLAGLACYEGKKNKFICALHGMAKTS